jgi:hypothetical protein
MRAARSLGDRIRNLFGGAAQADRGIGVSSAPAAPWVPSGAASSEQETVATRHSRGLEEFFGYIRGQTGLSILDLGGTCQANVSFITNLGHKLYSVDFLRSMAETFGSEDATDQSNPGRIDYFLRQNLEYPDDAFDGVLVWDVLEYMSPALLAATVDRLCRVARPKSYLLAFFHADGRPSPVAYYTFRIHDCNALEVAQRGSRRPVQLFNNRSLERLFQGFESVKFFLTREHLREVIIKR